MASARAYRARSRPRRSDATRERIVSAVRELLAEGAFHESTVEQVADRAGIARATLYQHFRSRLELVDAMCDTFDANPELQAIRASVALPDPDEALSQTLVHAVRFWSSEDAVLRQLYGVAAIDPAARDLIERQRDDRRGELERLVRRLRGGGRLRGTPRGALATLMLLTSFESYVELRGAGLSDREVTRTLQESARALLLG